LLREAGIELIGTTFPSDNILITDEPTEVFSPMSKYQKVEGFQNEAKCRMTE
jgi:hypothetical protein